jgi:K+-sensing histidine kinase KdpD
LAAPGGGDSITVSSDRTLLRRLVRDLVENAQRYGDSRFRVDLPVV